MISVGSTVKVRGRRNRAVVIAIIPSSPTGWRQTAYTVQYASGHVADVVGDDIVAVTP